MTYENADFGAARPGQAGVVFKCVPGDEYGWVADPEWWDDIDEPVTTVRQRWLLLEETKVTFHPRAELCPRCRGEEVEPCPIDTDGDGDCATCAQVPEFHGPCTFCGGDGQHPLAGQMEVES